MLLYINDSSLESFTPAISHINCKCMYFNSSSCICQGWGRKSDKIVIIRLFSDQFFQNLGRYSRILTMELVETDLNIEKYDGSDSNKIAKYNLPVGDLKSYVNRIRIQSQKKYLIIFLIIWVWNLFLFWMSLHKCDFAVSGVFGVG